jgi:hypothetical protein
VDQAGLTPLGAGLVASIRTWIENWNDEPRPYVWHEDADEILDGLAAYCQRINDSSHQRARTPVLDVFPASSVWAGRPLG